MKYVLFVDDDARVLSGIKRMLHIKRGEWQIDTAEGPELALAAMRQKTFDLVVTDMRMPHMDGAALLAEVKRLMPGAVRIVLSGQSEPSASARAVSVAHQFLSKPCTSEGLIDTLTRALALQDALGSADLLRLVGGVSSLPSPPTVSQALAVAMADPDVTIDHVVKTVRDDMALCAKVLQLVNSSFFGLGRPMSDLRQAVSYLGTATLRQLVLAAEVFGKFEASRFPAGFDLIEQQKHSVLVARIASDIVPDRTQAEIAFTAGLLHDVGEIVLACHLPEDYARTAALRLCGDRPAETDQLHRDATQLHCRLGAYLLGIWGLPNPVVEAVLHHHEPRAIAGKTMGLPGVVHVADCLSHLALSPDVQSRPALDSLDHEWLRSLGLDQEVPRWEERVAKMTAMANG